MGSWLFDIIKNNTLVDNQTYKVGDRVFSNQRLKEPIKLASAGRKTQAKHKDLLIWDFLFNTSSEVKNLLNKDNNVVLFNAKEYENNTDDDFIQISGKNIDNFTLKTGNLIGYVKKGEYALKISSRFGDQFLKKIISDADGFIEIEELGGTSKESSYEWLLIYLWKIKLKKAFRLGLPKQYINKAERVNKVKGVIDPLDYFLSRDGKYLCSYREHSYNNLAVQLIARVFYQYGEHQFLSDINALRNTFTTATNGVKTKLKELKSTQHFANPFYSDYNDVIDISKMLINNKSADFGGLKNNSAFFFDVSMLFEYFIRKILLRNHFDVQGKFEKPLKIPTGSLVNYKRKLEPDIIIEGEKGLFVFDVKYKYFDIKFGVKREDVFQLHTYVGQHGNNKNILGCGFIYPISESKARKYNINGMIKETMEIMGKNFPFYILFFIVPDEKDTNYNTSFTAQKSDFISLFKTIIN